MLKKIRYYISPYFILRHYLQRDIKYFAKKHKFEGKVLDIGCGQKPFENIFLNSEYVGIDFRDYSKNKDFQDNKPDIFFNEKYLHDGMLPFENESVDHTTSFQVLEHHKQPELMISEMARITKYGGLILLSCPFIYALHEQPNDFQRLTEYKFETIFKENKCEIVKIKKQGSLFSVYSMLTNEYLSRIAAKNNFYYLLTAFIFPPFLLFQYLCLPLDKIVKSDEIFINYLILARKIK